MEALNPITIQFLLDEELFFFNEVNLPAKSDFYFGQNRKQIIFISKYSFKIGDFELLYKILGALKLSIDDIALIDEEKFQGLDNFKSIEAKKIISFGKSFSEIDSKWAIQKYSSEKINGIDLLEVESFDQYHYDASKKKLLWENLVKLLN